MVVGLELYHLRARERGTHDAGIGDRSAQDDGSVLRRRGHLGAGDIWDGSNIWALAEHGFVRVSARGRGSGSGCSRIQIAAADKAESTAARARRADARCVHSPSKTVPTNGKPPTDDVEDEGLWTIGTHLFTAILSRAEEEASHKL